MVTAKTTVLPGLLVLPVELSTEIFRQLEKTDLQQLRLTCRALSKDCSISGKLFHTLHIDLYEDNNSPRRRLTTLLSFCAAVKSEKTDISPYVKRLVITGENWSISRLQSKVPRAMWKFTALFLDKRRLIKSLISILPRLTGLESLDLRRLSYPNLINALLVSSLTSMQSISDVTISDSIGFYPGTGESPFLPPFRNLTSFATYETLQEAHLTYIFQQSPRTLTHLSFAGCIGVMSTNVFQLWHGLPLRSISTYYDLPPSVWKALASTGIGLEHICVHHPIIHTALLEYLDSYSGLCFLSVRVANGERFTPEVIQNFFTKTLPKHRKSLTSIDTSPLIRFPWLRNAEALLALSQCTRIELLRLSIDYLQSPDIVAMFLDLLPSWHSLFEVEFYTGDQFYSSQPPETSAAVVDCLLAFRTFRYTYAMQQLTIRCFIWKITPKVFQDGSYGFSARVSRAKHPHDGEPYQGLVQHVSVTS